MGWRYRRSFRIALGLRLNVGKKGFTSLSVGGRGVTLNLAKKGVTSTVSLRGTGLSYQHRFKTLPAAQPSQPMLPPAPAGGRSISLRACVVSAVVVAGYLAFRSLAPSPAPAIPETSVAAPVVPAVVKMASPAAGGSQSATIVPEAEAAAVSAFAIQTRHVVTIQANVRAAPSMSGQVIRTFMQNQEVQVLQTENGWSRIAGQDGVSIGWMSNSVLK